MVDRKDNSESVNPVHIYSVCVI